MTMKHFLGVPPSAWNTLLGSNTLWENPVLLACKSYGVFGMQKIITFACDHQKDLCELISFHHSAIKQHAQEAVTRI